MKTLFPVPVLDKPNCGGDYMSALKQGGKARESRNPVGRSNTTVADNSRGGENTSGSQPSLSALPRYVCAWPRVPAEEVGRAKLFLSDLTMIFNTVFNSRVCEGF